MKKDNVEFVRVDEDGLYNYKKAGLAILDLLELHWGKLDGSNFDHFVNSGLLFIRYLSLYLSEEDRKAILKHAITMFEINTSQSSHPEKI